MATSLAFLFFGTLAVVGAFSMTKIHLQERADARAKRDEADDIERKRKARLEELGARCYRPDGD